MTHTDPIAAARTMIEPLTGYTPGPWQQGRNNPDRVIKSGEYISNCNPTHQSYPRIESNARLVASAPDLRDMVATLADALTAAQERIEALEGALRVADQFITNGIEMGYIRMPDVSTPDPAKGTPGIIRAALHATGKGDG